jgi:hypothetical protein
MLRITAFLGAALLALPAFAGETVCAERSVVLKQLSKEFSEQPIAIGLGSNGNVFELFNNRTNASWTIVMTMPSGKSCLMAAGEGWQELGAQSAKGPDA